MISLASRNHWILTSTEIAIYSLPLSLLFCALSSKYLSFIYLLVQQIFTQDAYFVLGTIPGIMDTGRKIPQKSLPLHFNVNKRNPYQGMSKGAKLQGAN